MTLRRCIHANSAVCRRHGGSGSSHHATGYTHPYAHKPIRVTSETVSEPFSDLHVYVDTNAAHRALGVDMPCDHYVNKGTISVDMSSADDVESLLTILPIADEQIVRELYLSIWPEASSAESLNPRLMRLQIIGYLHDVYAPPQSTP